MLGQRLEVHLTTRSCQTPFPRLSYHDSMARYGTDAPDIRFGLELVEVTEIVRHAHYEIFQKILSKKGRRGLHQPQGLAGQGEGCRSSPASGARRSTA